MLDKAYFQLIVPLSYDENDFSKISSIKNKESVSKKELQDTDILQRDTEIWFRYSFFPKSFSNTSQMEASPLLEDAFCERFELTQVQRTHIGIYQNENQLYTMKRENISFQIGKIRLVFTSFGIALLCMEIHTGPLDEKQILDFNAILRDIRRNPRILYKTSIAKDEYVEKTIGLKDIVKNIIQLQSYIKLSEYKGETFSSTYRLLYVIGSIHKEKLPAFFEICRNSQKSTEFSDDSVAQEHFEKYCLMARRYLYFAVGMKAIVGYADLDSAGMENKLFLTDTGGLQQSISENYLLIYLYMISILLCIKRMDRGITDDDLDWVEKIINLRRTDLSNVVHINTLFEEYLAERAEGWGLGERLQNIKESYLKTNRNSEIEQIKNVVEEIKEDIEEIKEDVDEINRKTDILLRFVQNDLKNYLLLERKKLKENDVTNEDENQIGLFISKAADYIDEHMEISTDTIAKETTCLIDLFGSNNWEKMLPASRTSLVSAAILWKSCKDIKTDFFDYSGVCITATSALEAELKEIFFTRFIHYMVKTYGEPDICALNKTYSNWPEYLLSIPKSKVRSNSFINIVDIFTMGKLPYLFGKPDYTNKPASEHAQKQAELMKQRMEEYLKTIVIGELKNCPINVFTKPKGNSFIDKCESIRADYRNKAAHSDIIMRDDAEQCYNRIIGRADAYQYKTSIIGVLLELLDKIE